MKTLSNCENPSSNPLQTACCGIQEPAYDSENCSVSQRWFWKLVTVLLFITESRATLPPFNPIEEHKWFFQIFSQGESQKNQFAFISFGKIQFLPPCILDFLCMSYVQPHVDDWLSAFSKAELRLTSLS